MTPKKRARRTRPLGVWYAGVRAAQGAVAAAAEAEGGFTGMGAHTYYRLGKYKYSYRFLPCHALESTTVLSWNYLWHESVPERQKVSQWIQLETPPSNCPWGAFGVSLGREGFPRRCLLATLLEELGGIFAGASCDQVRLSLPPVPPKKICLQSNKVTEKSVLVVVESWCKSTRQQQTWSHNRVTWDKRM